MKQGAAMSRERGVIALGLRDGVLPAAASAFPVERLLAVAAEEGVLPLLEWRLRGQSLPEALREGLSRGAREAAQASLHRDAQLRRIASCLADVGIKSLLLKGPAFARSLYPEPHLRMSGDIDLLFGSRREAESAAEALAGIGFERAFSPTSMTYEMTSRMRVDGRVVLELDLHSRLVNLPAFADVFAFEELWSSSIALAGLGDRLRVLSPLHAFVHACIHRAVDLYLQLPPRLKWLYDLHLMLLRLDAAGDWDGFLHLVRRKRVAGVCLRSIIDTVDAFGSPVPESVLQALHGYAGDESIDWRRLHDWRYMQWRNLKALPNPVARLRWLWERLFPTRSHLRELHGQGSWLRLMGRRAKRARARLRGGS